MVIELKPIRRVVTGERDGKSAVLLDGPAPNVTTFPNDPNRINTNVWVWEQAPLPIGGERDDGDLPYVFPGPPAGGHFRVVQAKGNPAGQEASGADHGHHSASADPVARVGGRAWDRGGKDAYSSAMHKTQSVDYGIVLDGERELGLDDATLVMTPGDIVVQVGAWHKWSSGRLGCVMAFDMIAAEFVDGPAGVGQGNADILRGRPELRLPEGVTAPRRIVTIDREPGKSSLVSDGPALDVVLDPARPGFASFRLWVTDSSPAKIVFETLHLPRSMTPPAGGSVLRVETYPPDAVWTGKVGGRDVAAFFESMGSPEAASLSALHPYMQKTGTLDICTVIEGEIVLVLETGDVSLKPGGVAVVRGGAHAFSNRSDRSCRLAVASHDARV